MSDRTNSAAWLVAPKIRPLEIRPSPMGIPGKGQILLKNRAIAINPIDGKLQATAIYPIDYPAILGEDIAGEVVAIGPEVTEFKPGDRVMAMPAGWVTKRSEESGFAKYTVVDTNTAAAIPASMSFERAAVLPLGISTASCGLFNRDFLNLNRPTHPAQKPNGEVLLVWGGASCVGTNTIQLAKAAGYEVIATASPKNFDLVKRIGAKHVFDYHSNNVVTDLLEVVQGKEIAGVYDAIGSGGAFEACVEFVKSTKGNKFIASVFSHIKYLPEGVQAKKVFAATIRDNGIAEEIWVGFLRKALADDAYFVATEPLIAGYGLGKIQDGIDLERKGLSAQKAVVLLD